MSEITVLVSNDETTVVVEETQAPIVIEMYQQGPEGIQGPPGPPGAAVSTYTHIQNSASDSWTVNHNLGFNPTVSVFSAGGLLVEADIIHISVNQTIINFVTAVSGSARFN